MMIRIAGFALLLSLSCAPFTAAADWEYGAYNGSPSDFFQGQLPIYIEFVKAHDFLARVALSHLSQCAGDDTDSLCHLNQPRFILDYIASFYGDHNSIQNVGFMLSGDGMPPRTINEGNTQIGVSPDPMWGCAFRISALISGSPNTDDGDLVYYRTDCQTLSSDFQIQAEGTAESYIVPTIHKDAADGPFPFSMVDNYPAPP